MAVTPNHQFYPQKAFLLDPFLTATLFTRTTLRHASSFPFKSKFFPKTICSQENPKRASKLNTTREETSLISSNSSWLDDWDGTHKTMPHKKLVNYNQESATVTGTVTSGGNTMDRIVDKLKRFGYMDDNDMGSSSNRVRESMGGVIQRGSVDDMFNSEPGFPWEKKGMRGETPTVDSRKSRSMAELTLPESELKRLRNLALRIKNKTRISGAGVTQQVVETIHDKWKTSEVCRLRVEGAAALNMKRIHEILERRTGGLVIWRSGTSVTLYRGVTYEDPAEKLKKDTFRRNEASQETSLINLPAHDSSYPENGATSINPDHENIETSSEVKYEDEIDELLDSLGPRYTDWPGEGPLPVDADLLPGVIPNYEPPFRLLPYGVRSTVGMKESTALRRLARTLPPHFALGRSRQHQGLAAAMVKLWERSSIAKIALKRGVQLTTSERMAEDLKRLTGGVLLSTNKDFLVFYRGKNFLSPDVAEALMEKERLARSFEDEEEQARLRASAYLTPSIVETDESGMAGTLKETLDADSKWGKRLDDSYKQKVMEEAEVLRHAELVRKLESKLQLAERKVKKAERALSKVEESLNPADHQDDPESLSDEERFMFRKLGLRMKAFLLLGRRGIFGGTVENMHLHWKYRELVKIMVKAKDIEEVKNIALSLEAESGGVLVSVDKVSKGYAIIVFRGRDYKRPSRLRPTNLLTKRKALARSIELQRQQAILNHISTLETRVNQLKCDIEQMEAAKDYGHEELYDHLDSAYTTEDEDSDLTEDEDSEEDGGKYFEKYTEDNVVEENDSIQTADLETDFLSNLQQEAELAQPWYKRELKSEM